MKQGIFFSLIVQQHFLACVWMNERRTDDLRVDLNMCITSAEACHPPSVTNNEQWFVSRTM